MVVTRSVFLKAVGFCAIAGVVLVFALVGAWNMGGTWGLFLTGAVLVASLLEWFLIWLMRGRQDGVVTRCLWLLKGVVFGCGAGALLLCTRVGAERIGVDWLWFSNEWVFLFIFCFTLPFIYEGARCVRVLWVWFLK